MKNYNTDYRKELPPNTKPTFVKDKTCPNCGSRLVVLNPDRVWCEDKDCDTGFLMIIGNGVKALKTYQE